MGRVAIDDQSRVEVYIDDLGLRWFDPFNNPQLRSAFDGLGYARVENN